MRDSTYLGEHNLVRLTGLGNSGRVVAVKTVAVSRSSSRDGYNRSGYVYQPYHVSSHKS